MRKALLGMLTVAAVLGCGGDGGSNADTKVRIAVGNASPDATSIDLALDGDTKFPAVGFGAVSAFRSFDPKEFDASVFVTGDPEVAWSESISTAAATDRLVATVGLRSFGSENEKRLRTVTATLDRSTPVGSRSRLFVVHGFVRQPGFSNSTVDLVRPGTPLTELGTDIEFGSIRAINLDSGANLIQVRQNDTEQVFVEKTLALAPGKIYVLLITGTEASTGAAAPDLKLLEIPIRDR